MSPFPKPHQVLKHKDDENKLSHSWDINNGEHYRMACH